MLLFLQKKKKKLVGVCRWKKVIKKIDLNFIQQTHNQLTRLAKEKIYIIHLGSDIYAYANE